MPETNVLPQLGIAPISMVHKIGLTSTRGLKLQEQCLIRARFNATIVKDAVTCKMSAIVPKSGTPNLNLQRGAIPEFPPKPHSPSQEPSPKPTV